MKKNARAINHEFPEGGPVKLARLPAAYVQRLRQVDGLGLRLERIARTGAETRGIARRPFHSELGVVIAEGAHVESRAITLGARPGEYSLSKLEASLLN